MSNFVEVLKACESASGAGTKETIQNALATIDAIGLRLLNECMNSYRVFGVRKYDEPTEFAKTDPDPSFIFPILDAMCARELTGNAARNAVTRILASFTQDTASYIARIFDKDPRAGFSVDTVNQVLLARGMTGNFNDNFKKVKKLLKVEGWNQFHANPEFKNLIPTFEVQLAEKCETEEDFERIANEAFPCQGDVKYDGERNVAIVTHGEVHYFSRSGKEVFHLPESIDIELLQIHRHLNYDFVLDGERFGKDFTATMNAKKGAKDGTNLEVREGLHFRAFFLMPLSDWKAQKTNITMQQARAHLKEILDTLQCKKIILSEGKILNNITEMHEYCNHVIDDLKMEGLILKRLNDVYRWERNLAWTKVKRFYDVDLRVTGWYPGRPKSRLEHTVGGLTLEGVDEKGVKIRTNVGSGLSDEQRDDILKNWSKYEGKTAVIKYQEMTQSADQKGTDIFSLRFGTLERFRDDKVVELLD